MSSFHHDISFVVVALWAFSSLPAVTAAPAVCYTNSFGYQNCGWRYSGWGIGVSIVVLLLLFVVIFSCTRHYGEEEVTRVNMAYVPYSQRAIPTTYAANYDPEAAPANTHGPGNQRTRPTSYSSPYTSYDRANEPQYPQTAYPFTGYSVPPPLSRGPSKVHNTVKTKDTVV